MNETKGTLTWRKYRKGVYFALATAIISGFSIYINKFAVMEMKDPFIFTTVKNLAVAALLFAFLILPKALPELRALSRKQWLTLGAIGCVGGSIPFLLFFYGLSLGTAGGAALVHKTLFIWVAILAVFFLGERLGRWHRKKDNGASKFKCGCLRADVLRSYGDADLPGLNREVRYNSQYQRATDWLDSSDLTVPLWLCFLLLYRAEACSSLDSSQHPGAGFGHH